MITFLVIEWRAFCISFLFLFIFLFVLFYCMLLVFHPDLLVNRRDYESRCGSIISGTPVIKSRPTSTSLRTTNPILPWCLSPSDDSSTPSIIKGVSGKSFKPPNSDENYYGMLPRNKVPIEGPRHHPYPDNSDEVNINLFGNAYRSKSFCHRRLSTVVENTLTNQEIDSGSGKYEITCCI